jgi:hypothetical protein
MSHGVIVKRTTGCLALLIALGGFSPKRASALLDATDIQDSPLGEWRGMSVCQVKPSGCHDEDSLYRFRTVGRRDGEFELQADKIVDGKPVTMGTSPCTHNASGQLICRVSESATLSFDVRGNEMQGVFKMRNGTIWRKLTLKRVPQ